MPDFKIHHISINVSDLIESYDFYLSLGFTEYYRYCSPDESLRIIHLLKEGFILELFYYLGAPACKAAPCEIEHSEFIGVEHFSFLTDNIEEAYQVLNKHINCNNGIQAGRTGIRFFFINDPDGNRIEIVEDKRNLHTNQ